MKVFKRNGVEQDFDDNKIMTAIQKANDSVPTEEQMNEKQMKAVIETVHSMLNGVTSIKVEDIQDIVEKALVKNNQYAIAKSYIIYRNNKLNAKQFTETEEQIISVVAGDNTELRSENANKHIDINSTVRDYIAGVCCKAIAEKMLPKHIVEAHKKKWIHFHDMDYSPLQHLHNCDLLNIENMLQNGFQMGDVHIDKPKKFSTACNLLAQINLQVSSSQYGGQTVSWAHLIPFVKESRASASLFIDEVWAKLPLLARVLLKPIAGRLKTYLIERITRYDIYTGVKTYQYQTLSGYTANGQTPFVTNVLNLREAETQEELDDMALVFEEILKRRLKGVKDKSGKYVGPLFPKLLYFTCDGLNLEPEDPYYYLTKLAARCIALRMQPDIMSEKKTREIKRGQLIPVMGCLDYSEKVELSTSTGRIGALVDQLRQIHQNGNAKIKIKSVGKKSEIIDVSKLDIHIKDGVNYVKLKAVVVNHGVSDWYRVTYQNHRSRQHFLCTSDHPLPVKGGQVKAVKDLTLEDRLISCLDPNDTFKILEVEPLTYVADSFDVTTESGYFNINQSVRSHNCRSALAGVWEDVRMPTDTKFHWQWIDDENITYPNAPGANFNYKRGFGEYSTLPINSIEYHSGKRFAINFQGNTGWLKEIDEIRNEFVITKPKVYGRFNCGVVTINLPHVALTAKKRVDEGEEKDLDLAFYKVLDERLALCHEALLERWKSIQQIKAKNSPILWMHGAITRMQPEAKVADYIMSKEDPATTSISLGYIGLCETCKVIKGQSNTTDEGRDFCKKVLTYLNDTLACWKNKDHLGYSPYGSPEENLTYAAALALQRDFGFIEGVTDKDYVVNSYHVDPREEINAFKKLEIEGEYLALSSGGAVSYVETADLTDNPEAIETLIRFMHDHIMYAEVNRKIGICYACGYQGDVPLTKTENGEFEFTCPNCGEKKDLSVDARLCGYVGTITNANVNKGRLDDIYHRKLHLN